MEQYPAKCPRIKSKLLDISKSNLVLFWDHPEGGNKIQDKYNESEFIMAHMHAKPNVYNIKPVKGKGPVFTVNQCQLQDLKSTQEIKNQQILMCFIKCYKYPLTTK